MVKDRSPPEHQNPARQPLKSTQLNSLHHNKVLLSKSFDSFEEIAMLARAWNADFRQVSSSHENHRVLQVVMDGMLMSRGKFGCHLDQRGATPQGLRTFAMLEEGCAPMHWFGRTVGPNDLLVFPAHGEIDVFSQPGFCNHSFSVSMDELAAFFERFEGPDLGRLLGPEDTVLGLSRTQLRRLRGHLRKISFRPVELQKSLTLYDAYKDKLFALLLGIFQSQATLQARPGNRIHRGVFREMVELVHRHKDERIKLERFSRLLKVPERSLNEVFRTELGISPGLFIKGQRLFGVHRSLWHSRPSEARVTDIANDWGFWHMGQFAADYRQLFGELPSQTLKRHPG